MCPITLPVRTYVHVCLMCVRRNVELRGQVIISYLIRTSVVVKVNLAPFISVIQLVMSTIQII